MPPIGSKVPVKKTTPAKQVSNDPDHKIVEGLLKMAVACDSLVYDPENARKHPEENMEAIKGSLRKYGQVKPIVVRQDTNVVIAGNGTLQAVRALGWSHIAAVFVDFDDTDAMGFGIADNRTAELAEWDYEQLSSTLRQLQQEEIDLHEQGWLPHQLEPLLLAEWTPPSIDDDYEAQMMAQDRGKSVKFTTPQFKTVEHAIRVARAKLGKEDVEDPTCLEEICRAYLKYIAQ